MMMGSDDVQKAEEFGDMKSVERQRGFSLIEVLVAVLVLAIGLLGLAGLQTRGLKASQSSYERSVATVYAYSILDAMRANALRSDDPAVQLAAAQAYVTNGWQCDVPTDTSSLAKKDLKKWIEELQANVRADACGRVSQVGTTGLQFSVEVCWPDLGGGSDTATDNCAGGERATTLKLESLL